MQPMTCARPQALLSSEQRSFMNGVTAGLGLRNKRLPSRYLFDARGLDLLDRLREQPEYYLARAEEAVLRLHAPEIASCFGPRSHVLELSRGRAILVRGLIDRFAVLGPAEPVGISRAYLSRQAARLSDDLPNLFVQPFVADFTHADAASIEAAGRGFPADRPRRRVVFLPGAMIGHLEPREISMLMRRIGRLIGTAGGFLVSADSCHSRPVVEAAYNDRAGAMRDLNLNLIQRMIRELDVDVDPLRFEHHAEYNEAARRVEMHLVSLGVQTIHVGEERFSLTRGERIQTQIGRHFAPDEFTAIARAAGFRAARTWTDESGRYALHYLLSD